MLATIADAEGLDPANRIRAIDVMAKYGLGQLREASVDDVRDRLRQTIGILREELDETTANHLIGRLAEVWQR